MVQTGIGRFGEGLQQDPILVETDDALPTTPMGQGLDGTRFAQSAQQVLQPSFGNLEAFGKIRLGSFLRKI